MLLYSDASTVYFDIMLINVLNNEHLDILEKDARKGEEGERKKPSGAKRNHSYEDRM